MNADNVWSSIDYLTANELYERRYALHQKLVRLLQGNAISDYVKLALGITDPAGNYSASEHGLGPRILQESSSERVFNLAVKLFACQNPNQILDIIYYENIPFLKVSVGSEMAALLKPKLFWVVNARTIWAHFVIIMRNVDDANSILRAYREDMPSEMEYLEWKEIFPDVGPSMTLLSSLGTQIAQLKGIQPGAVTFLWADAIADTAYNAYSK